MKRISTLLILLSLSLMTFAQVKLGVQTGRYFANNYTNIQPGNNICIEVSHLLQEHLIITTQANYGNSRYFNTDTNINNVPTEEGATNADLSTIHVGLMAGYYTNFSKWFSASAQIGVSTYTQESRYPYQYEEFSYAYAQSSFTDIAFPVKASLGFSAFKDFEIAFVVGCYIEPDYPIVGFHFGPQINLSF
ncbi:MAG: hypothetical protein ACERKD_09525 [Prolixibacteraceae bacterium]